MTQFSPKILSFSNAENYLYIKDTYAHVYYNFSNYSLLVAYTDIETEQKSFSGVIPDGEYSKISLKLGQSLVSYYLIDNKALPETVEDKSEYIQNTASKITGLTTGVGHIHYRNGKPAIYGLDYADFKSLATTTIISNRAVLSISAERVDRLRSSLEEGQENSGQDAETSDRDSYTYQNFLMQASQRAVLQLISSLEGSISIRYPEIDTNIYDGMPCWFVKDGDMFLASCTAPTISWSVESGANTDFSVINIRSIKSCLELINKPMGLFKEVVDIKPFFSSEGVLSSMVLDWREYCYIDNTKLPKPQPGMTLFKELCSQPEELKKIGDQIFAMSSRDFIKIASFFYTDPTNIADWARAGSELFSDISYENYKYILPQPNFSSNEYYIENVDSVNSIYESFPTENFFYSSLLKKEGVTPFIYNGIGDNQIPGQTTKSIVASLKTFVKSIQQLPPYNVNWWDSGVVRTVSKVIWE